MPDRCEAGDGIPCGGPDFVDQILDRHPIPRDGAQRRVRLVQVAEPGELAEDHIGHPQFVTRPSEIALHPGQIVHAGALDDADQPHRQRGAQLPHRAFEHRIAGDRFAVPESHDQIVRGLLPVVARDLRAVQPEARESRNQPRPMGFAGQPGGIGVEDLLGDRPVVRVEQIQDAFQPIRIVGRFQSRQREPEGQAAQFRQGARQSFEIARAGPQSGREHGGVAMPQGLRAEDAAGRARLGGGEGGEGHRQREGPVDAADPVLDQFGPFVDPIVDLHARKPLLDGGHLEFLPALLF
ncbi:hypothetical protein [Nocardia yamanashiensis]|uniref:hypothetical protein n=1 Tax=Nocardia yamanashiensis TaxID=209247 RepID=UPI00083481CE|nr:hypothetical protein [Nocardia yamanashiensis]